MPDAKSVGDQPVLRLDNVVITVVWKFTFQPIAWLARFTGADAVRNDDEVLARVERLSFGEQLVRQSRQHPALARSTGAVQQHDAICNFALRIALWHAEGDVMQAEFGQGLAV